MDRYNIALPQDHRELMGLKGRKDCLAPTEQMEFMAAKDHLGPQLFFVKSTADLPVQPMEPFLR